VPATRNSTFLYLVVAASLVVVARAALMHRDQAVVASTSLTGALAQAAGARQVRILTPLDVKHPPEYELRPSDIAQLNGASAVVYGGHEKMARRLVEVSKGRGLPVVQVDTTISPGNFTAQARKIAAVYRTVRAEQAWEKDFLERAAFLKSRLAPYSGKKAVVHLYAQSFAAWAGLTVVQVIMPGEISSNTVAEAKAKQPDIVLDILDMPAARMIAENARCPYAALITFPGAEKTATLRDILEYDTAQILKAFGQ
jgi:hypothetical protein